MRMNEQWRKTAACRTMGPDLFFLRVSQDHTRDNGYGREAEGAIAAAKAVCATCLVSGACLDYAMSTHQEHGIWGGLTERERYRLRRRRRRSEDARRSA